MEEEQYDYMFDQEDTYWWFVGKRYCVRRLLDSFVDSGKKNAILDIGCGTGGMTCMLSDWGTVSAIEPNERARRYSKKRGISVRAGTSSKLPQRSSSQQLVTMFDVFYHKGVEEQKTLQEIRRVLSKGGLFILTDCAYPWLWSKHDDIMHARKRFVRHELVDSLHAAGFNVLFSSYFYFFTFPLFVVNRMVQKYGIQKSTSLPIMPGIINFLLIYCMRIEAFLLKYVRFPWGSSIVVVAQKT